MNLTVMSGILYVVATPIGNLADITRRGAMVLESVAIIAAEDTRRSRVLLAEIGAGKTKMVALHDHNESHVGTKIVASLTQGSDVALISDAGTPLLSDPGFDLVRRCWEAGIEVIPIPGPSAVLAALCVCPLPAQQFYFEGFLPAKSGLRKSRLTELLEFPFAVIFFETPHRIESCLSDLSVLAPERRLMIGREMTKRHETYRSDTPERLLQFLQAEDQLRGEFVCILEAKTTPDSTASDVRRIMQILCKELAPAQAARIGAQLSGHNKAELYSLAVEYSQDR
ncbi:MAG: 16S rRNA (cytidine(1402)-2'-O)-methyltransferase [Gammaproteobacteria bacterium]|nr:16S rRNA (cytidine(1402)-2'-O)-methyltransferase [Gammaproteobacteria bacterium]